MKKISLSDLRRFGSKDLKEMVPVIVTCDGEELFVMGAKELTICTDDLHPRVRTQLKNAERKTRVGMPQVTQIYGPVSGD